MRVACALTRLFDQWRCVCSAAQMAWPRACAARIIATLESLYALRDSSGSTMKSNAAPKLKDCGLLDLRHHELDRGADFGVGERRVAGFGRHRALALDHRLQQLAQAFLDARRPCRLVAELRRVGDAGLVAGGAHALHHFLAAAPTGRATTAARGELDAPDRLDTRH